MLLVITIISLPINVNEGFNTLNWHKHISKSMEVDLLKGSNPNIIANKYQRHLIWWWHQDEFIEKLNQLKRFNVKPFNKLK